jgi:hypothetical protein
MNRIDEKVKRSKATGQKRAPPPAIVLGAQVKVAEQNGGFRARDYQDQIDYWQKAKHVVELVRPDAVQDEEKLDENASERQNATHEYARQWSGVKMLDGYLTWYLVGADWVLDWSSFKSQVGAYES